MYSTIYTRRGTPQHDRMIDAYIDHGQHVMLSGAWYVIVDLAWIPLAEAFRWHVRAHTTAVA